MKDFDIEQMALSLGVEKEQIEAELQRQQEAAKTPAYAKEDPAVLRVAEALAKLRTRTYKPWPEQKNIAAGKAKPPSRWQTWVRDAKVAIAAYQEFAAVRSAETATAAAKGEPEEAGRGSGSPKPPSDDELEIPASFKREAAA